MAKRKPNQRKEKTQIKKKTEPQDTPCCLNNSNGYTRCTL
jgi:hypothetical protein